MADYKVVDAEKLNSDLSAVAKSIRAQSEPNGGLLLFPDGFVSAINGIQKGIIPTDIINITQNVSNMDITMGKLLNVNVPIPDGYIDTSDATAIPYDICSGKTAYVDGKKVTGEYACIGRSGSHQWNASSEGCSATELVIACNFKPTGLCIILNSATYTTNTIIAFWGVSNAATYHSRTSSGVTRNQYTSGVTNYWSYDENSKKVTIKSANSTYKWATNNYRCFLFK